MNQVYKWQKIKLETEAKQAELKKYKKDNSDQEYLTGEVP